MTFKEWEEVTETENTIEVNRDTIRDVYTFPNGMKVYHDVTLPWNFLQPQREFTVVDTVIPVNEANTAYIESLGGRITEDWYTEEGFGMPLFRGENSLEIAFNYSMKERAVCIK